jgi:hypothetical protein
MQSMALLLMPRCQPGQRFLLLIDQLDAAKLPLNGHTLALFKAKREMHQPNGVLAMLLRNQA